MTNRLHLLEELRARMKDGATPSELVRHVLAVRGNSVSHAER